MNSIEVHNLFKKFRIYHDKSVTLKERILYWGRTKYSEIQVLNDVSFNVEKGKTIGLIGQNGSGKSTLLKLLTGIIYPDKGSININGKVSSLLELGAGFHPDFSGRENIYNNASIFGLSKKEIDKRFNQIVTFSELEEFIDNPVRTYSSGMYMRLAFSVAINVDADILLIDEILAVGDASFQKKCMDKIKDLKKMGTTIVLVTHDMGAVERICDEAVWLEGGRIKQCGNSLDTVSYYLEFMGEKQENSGIAKKKEDDISNTTEDSCSDNHQEMKSKNRWGSKEITIEDMKFIDNNGMDRTVFKCGEKVVISFRYNRYNKSIENPVFGVGIFRNDGVNCYGTNTQIDKIRGISIGNSGEVHYIIENLNLLEGQYIVDVAVVSEDGFPYDYIRGIAGFNVYSDIKDIGVIRLNHQWQLDDKLLD